jgi:hypothetical protein
MCSTRFDVLPQEGVYFLCVDSLRGGRDSRDSGHGHGNIWHIRGRHVTTRIIRVFRQDGVKDSQCRAGCRMKPPIMTRYGKPLYSIPCRIFRLGPCTGRNGHLLQLEWGMLAQLVCMICKVTNA